MMPYYMVRSFDHAGYYETRLILMLIAVSVALIFKIKRGDNRYLVILLSGVFWQALMEYLLQSRGMRGSGYALSVFGVQLSGVAANVFQGCAEGGILSLMAFWFVDLIRGGNRAGSRNGYLAVCGLIIVLACVVGYLASGRPITSARPMFGGSGYVWRLATSVPAILLMIWSRGLRYLWYFYIGLMVYVLITFEPLHILGARYIAIRTPQGFTAAPLWPQIGVMLYSHLVEVAGGKIHYFAVPFALGLVKVPYPIKSVRRSSEPISDEHVQSTGA